MIYHNTVQHGKDTDDRARSFDKLCDATLSNKRKTNNNEIYQILFFIYG